MTRINIKDLIIPTIIFVSDETVLFGSNANPFFIYLKYLILLGVAFYLLSLKRPFADSKVSQICIIMCCIILVSSIINHDLRLGLIYKIVVLTISCLIVQVYGIKEFANRFESFVYFLACFSLVGYSINLFAPSIISLFPKITNTAGGDYYNLLFYTQQIERTTEIPRNEGCFREAGVFQMFLNIALVFQLYFADSFKVKHFVVLLVVLGLTFSTTGIITGFLVLLLFLFSSKSSYMGRKTKMGLIFILTAAIAVLITKSDYFSAEGVLFAKFQQENNLSSISRLSSITSNFEIWKSKPLFGSGLQIEDLYSKITLATYGIESEHNTNTLLYELACWGIFYFLILIWGISKFCSKIGNKWIEHLLMFAIIVFLSIGEKLVFSTFFFVLMFYGYNKYYLHSKDTVRSYL